MLLMCINQVLNSVNKNMWGQMKRFFLIAVLGFVAPAVWAADHSPKSGSPASGPASSSLASVPEGAPLQNRQTQPLTETDRANLIMQWHRSDSTTRARITAQLIASKIN